MNKKFFIFIFSLIILVCEYNSLIFASSNIPSNICPTFFSSQRASVNSTVTDNFIDAIHQFKNYKSYQAHRVVDRMLQDLISAYQQKILEVISSNPNVKNLKFPTNNNPIIPPSYINSFMENLAEIFIENVNHHLFIIRYKPEAKIDWDSQLFLLRYLEIYFKRQFGENEIKNYIPSSLIELIDDDFSIFDTEEEHKIKDDFGYNRTEKNLMRLTPKLTATINSVFNIKNKYLEILLQHILTYYILNDENYKLDPTLKRKMLSHVLYVDAYGNYVTIRDFLPSVIDNVKFLSRHRSSYASLIKDPTVIDKEQFLAEVYPSILLGRSKISNRIGQFLLEQDMIFLKNYIKYSTQKDIVSNIVNTFLRATSEEKALELFQQYADVPSADIFNLDQIFYVGNFPISLKRLVKALLNTSTLNFSTRDIVDLILGLYHTDIQALAIDYDTAVKKFNMINDDTVDNTKSLYFPNIPNIDYVYDFYQILYYLISNDPDFCEELGLKNKNIISSLKETLLEKLVI